MKKCLFKVQSVLSNMSTVSNIWSGMFYLIFNSMYNETSGKISKSQKNMKHPSLFDSYFRLGIDVIVYIPKNILHYLALPRNSTISRYFNILYITASKPKFQLVSIRPPKLLWNNNLHQRKRMLDENHVQNDPVSSFSEANVVII